MKTEVNENQLEFDVCSDRVKSKERRRVRDNPIIDVSVAVEVRSRPKTIFFLRSAEVQREQFELDETCSINVRTYHWFHDELGQSVSVGLPAFFNILEPRFTDVRCLVAGVVNGAEKCVRKIAVHTETTYDVIQHCKN